MTPVSHSDVDEQISILGAKVLGSRVEVDNIAQCFVKARADAVSLADYPGTVPADLTTAYAIQDAAIALVEDDVLGWKVGRIQPPRSEELGTTRLAGPIFAKQVQWISTDSHNLGAIFDGGFGAIEAEFIFRIGTPPKVDQRDLSLEDTSALIDAVFVGFEIASSPFPGINSLGPLVTITDFGNNNGLIIGPEIPNWRTSGFEGWTVETRAGGEVLGTGQAVTFPGGPMESAMFLINNLIERGITIAPGLMISTGAVSGVHEVTSGQQIEARFGADYKIECEMVQA